MFFVPNSARPRKGGQMSAENNYEALTQVESILMNENRCLFKENENLMNMLRN